MSSWYLDSAEGPWNVNQRLKNYKASKMKDSVGADLRERYRFLFEGHCKEMLEEEPSRSLIAWNYTGR
jgi:hypothetical protein